MFVCFFFPLEHKNTLTVFNLWPYLFPNFSYLAHFKSSNNHLSLSVYNLLLFNSTIRYHRYQLIFICKFVCHLLKLLLQFLRFSFVAKEEKKLKTACEWMMNFYSIFNFLSIYVNERNVSLLFYIIFDLALIKAFGAACSRRCLYQLQQNWKNLKQKWNSDVMKSIWSTDTKFNSVNCNK